MAGNRNKILKILIWILVGFLLLLSATGIFYFQKTENYLNKNLPTIISEKSDGLYNLNFSRINFSIIPFSIVISDIVLTPDEIISKQKAKESPGKVFYSFSSPELKITSIDVIEFIRNQSFQCDKIVVSRPVIELSSDETISNDSIQSTTRIFAELRPLFQKQVKEIKVKNIDLVNANYKIFNLEKDSTQISNALQISIGVRNFRTDSAMIFSNEKLFESDDIFIRMYAFQHNLGDNLHYLKIDSLDYSLQKSEINASGFHLSFYLNNAEKSLYEVTVPQLYLKSKSLTRFALNDSVSIQYLQFINPAIRFYQKENPKQLKIEDINNFNLYSLIENQFSKIKIDSFYFSNANIELFKQPDFEEYQQQFASVNIRLNNFLLDSVSIKNTDKLLHADDLEMEVKNYHLKLEDNQHDFRADSMFFSTYSNTLGLKNITIQPLNEINQQTRVLVNINCESLDVSEVNLKTLFHTRTLPTRKIEVIHPNVHLTYNTEIEKSEKQKEAGLLFELVSAYLRGVYSDSVLVDNGKLNIQNLNNKKVLGYFETAFQFNLTGFSLDSASVKQTDKFFYASNFDLEFDDYQMRLVDDLHKLDVDRISILSTQRKIEIQNLKLQPVNVAISAEEMKQFNRSELYNISVPLISLTGVNLRNAFFYNKLNISQFLISNPEIHIENFAALRDMENKFEFSELSQLIFNYIEDINISAFDIPRGTLTWINHTKKGKTISFDNDFSASLENFLLNEAELNKKRLLFSDNFEISVKDQMFQLSDSVHILKAGEISVSSKNNSVKIRGALLYPAITSEKYSKLSTTLQVTIPALDVSNINFQKAYYDKELVLTQLEIENPRFQVYSKTGTAKSLDLKKYQFPFPAFFNSLQLKEFKITNAEVITYETEGSNHRARGNFKINLSFPDVSVKNNAENQAQVTTGNIIAQISGLKSPLGKNHLLEISQADFNRSRQSVVFRQLKINPFSQNYRGNRFSIFAPEISFSNFDLKEAFDNNNFIFGEINASNPEITIEMNDSLKGNKIESAKNLDLYPYIESYVDQIKVNQLNLKNVKLDLDWFDKTRLDREFDVVFSEINIGENQNPADLLHSKEFEISTTNLSTTTNDKLYEFNAESLVYNSLKNNVILKNISINPLLTRDDFFRKAGIQTDYLKAKTSFIEIRDIDENEWLKNNILEAGTLVFGKTELDIFRNKRYPFNHSQRPPWPQDLLKTIKQPFVFDSFILEPTLLRYSELMDISDEPGTIEFKNLIVKTGKISNRQEEINRFKNVTVDAGATIFDSGNISASFNFDLTSKNQQHTVKGSISEMPLQRVNAMLEKAAPVSVVSGNLNRFDFNLKLDDKQATGELYFGYDNFKINIMEKKAEEMRISKLATFWANKMMLNPKNPKGDKFEPVTIFYERDEERSIINYWWKSIFTGSKIVLGIDDEKSE
jgi:hypothetical protein